MTELLCKDGTPLKNQMSIQRRDLEDLEIVKEHRPPSVGYCAGSIFSQFENTNCYQWFANTSGGVWTPFGPIFIGLEDK